MTLKEMAERYANNQSSRAIAKEAGIHRHRVVRLLKSMGVKIEPRGGAGENALTSRELHQIIILYFEYRWGMKRIALKLGRANSTIERAIKRIGFPIRSRSEASVIREARKRG